MTNSNNPNSGCCDSQQQPEIKVHDQQQVPEKVCSSLADAVRAIGALPDLNDYLANFVPTETEKHLFKLWHFQYSAVEFWLESLVLEKPLKYEGFLSPRKDYYPHAELCAENFKLASAIYPKSEVLQIIFASPIDLWVACEMSESKRRVKASGLLTGFPELSKQTEEVSGILTEIPKFMGKSEYLDWSRDYIDAFADCEVYGVNNIDWSENIDLLLASAGQKIAKENGDFETDTWNPYWRLRKRFLNKIKNSKHLKVPLLYKEELILTSKSQKLPKPSTGKRKPC
jgi:hypothetical protein